MVWTLLSSIPQPLPCLKNLSSIKKKLHLLWLITEGRYTQGDIPHKLLPRTMYREEMGLLFLLKCGRMVIPPSKGKLIEWATREWKYFFFTIEEETILFKWVLIQENIECRNNDIEKISPKKKINPNQAKVLFVLFQRGRSIEKKTKWYNFLM